MFGPNEEEEVDEWGPLCAVRVGLQHQNSANASSIKGTTGGVPASLLLLERPCHNFFYESDVESSELQMLSVSTFEADGSTPNGSRL